MRLDDNNILLIIDLTLDDPQISFKNSSNQNLDKVFSDNCIQYSDEAMRYLVDDYDSFIHRRSEKLSNFLVSQNVSQLVMTA